MKERKELLQPGRIEYARIKLNELGYDVEQTSQASLRIIHRGSPVIIYPYTGWFTGKTVKDGRGIYNLLKQLKNENTNKTRIAINDCTVD